MPDHEIFMRRCIELALLGAGSVSPNPMVGSVIVCEGRIIGEGYHKKYGEAHAEVHAVESVFQSHSNAENLLKRATLYVNLEPCAHFGKRPPCADLIVRYQIPRVVIGCRDPFKLVDGKGIEKLTDAGVQVVENVLTSECLQLNRRFFTRVQKQRPYIILKWAQTSDRFFAPSDSSQRWISSMTAKKLVHKWRAEEDAVLIGRKTALIDNPHLNVRLWEGRNPVRIVIDRNLQLPTSLNLFDQSQPTIVFNSVKTELDGNIKYLELEDFDSLLPQLICYQLYLMDVQSIIIEGGAEILNTFISAGLWDEARIFEGNINWEDGIPAPRIQGLLSNSETIENDILEIWHNPL